MRTITNNTNTNNTNIYFTANTNICNSNDSVIERWNSVVNANDTVYAVGNLATDLSAVEKLKGKIFILLSDTDMHYYREYLDLKHSKKNKNIIGVESMHLLQINSVNIFLCYNVMPSVLGGFLLHIYGDNSMRMQGSNFLNVDYSRHNRLLSVDEIINMLKEQAA